MKTHLALIVLLFIASTTSVLIAQTSVAFASGSSIAVQSPRDSEVILDGKLNVEFSIDASKWSVSSIYKVAMGVECIIDGIVRTTWYPTVEFFPYSFFVNGLSEGEHQLEIKIAFMTYQSNPDGSGGTFAEAELVDTSGLISFTIGFPQISNLSIQNRTYNTNLIPLNYSMTSEVDWQLGYVLDGRPMCPSGNTTLVLSEGSHRIAIGVTDRQGNTRQSGIVFFTVKLPTPIPSSALIQSAHPTIAPTPSPSVAEFPTWIILPLMAVAAILIVYFRKQKRS